MKQVPTPTSLSTVILPPIYSTRFLHILSPIPVPYLFISSCSSNLLNLIKSFSIFYFEIPLPESVILITSLTLDLL